MHNTMVTRINNTVLPLRPRCPPPKLKHWSTFQSMEAATKIFCSFTTYSLTLPLPTSSISIYTLKYTYLHTRHKSCSFSCPGVLRLLRPANSHPVAKSWQVRWGNSVLQDTLEFSLKTVKSQEASL